jgi:molybdopterin molybdotransferase/putative molybdopterin biosynthesis protein
MLIPTGRTLRPGDLAVAIVAGHSALQVARRPVVAIIPTGDEIRPAGAPLRPGDVADSNSVMLAARAVQAGARPETADVQPDDPDEIVAEVRRAAPAADLVLILAGSSAGRDDHTAAVLEQAGGVTAHGVAVRPGHPVLLGHAKAGQAGVVPVIGVPGYPLAAAVIFELFALPVLTTLQGNVPASRTPLRAMLDRDWTSPADVEEWVPVTLRLAPHPDGPVFAATPTPGRGAGAVSRISRADAWWRIPTAPRRAHRTRRPGRARDQQPVPRPDAVIRPMAARNPPRGHCRARRTRSTRRRTRPRTLTRTRVGPI